MKKLRLVKVLGLRAASSAVDKSSLVYMHQPKEPDNIQHRLDAMKKKQ